MTWAQLKKNSEPHFHALVIDKYLPKVLRSAVRKVVLVGGAFFFLSSFGTLPLDFSYADGAFFLCIFVYLSFSFLECFYRSMKNEGLHSRIRERILEDGPTLDYSLSKLVWGVDEIDVTRSLCETAIGRNIFERSGVAKEDSKEFAYSNRSPIIASTLALGEDSATLSGFVATLYDADISLQHFLGGHGVNKEEFVGSAKMVSDIAERKRREDRFWSRESLGSIPSIGTSWGYGMLLDLGKFGTDFGRSTNLTTLDIDNGYRDREVSLLEGVLERQAEANAIIIDDDESVARDIVGRLLKRIKLGVALPSLEHKSIIELDWTSIVASFKDKTELQKEILQILNQATSASSAIIYIRDMPGFVSSLKASGINLPTLISPYLASNNLQIIAHAGNTDFHYFIETSPTLLERFERIIPDEVGAEASLPAVIEKALSIEKDYKITFAFAALRNIVISAERYISVGEMPGKALDLLLEIAPYAAQNGIKIVKESDVSSFVSTKTGITSGPIKQAEAERIEKLEELLHNRVVGQNVAISAIASAMRRARSGLVKPNRPLASFLFLGPTGVGKTETSKALAANFFGNEDKMLRLDMSEYNGADALSRLIGSFGENRSGVLASKVRDNPYGVLLLDELEKAARDVLDLFLQILDEGIFTDALGKKVNCRNLIIIATSNAGSQLIWSAIQAGKDLAVEQAGIVDSIIKEGVFKPELLNRFDGVVLFHPLQNEELKVIARLELDKFAKRLKEQEIEFVITDSVINFLVEKGSDPQFGARSLNRAIQNTVEDIVAKKIVSGEAGPGSKIEIKKEELR